MEIFYNVNKLLEWIFPTVFPKPRNNYDSYSRYFNPSFNTSEPSDISFKGILPTVITNYIGDAKPSFSSYYSYLKINNITYTITKVVWLNDILNHPKYNELIDEFETFHDLRRTKEKEIDIKIEEESKKLKNADTFLSVVYFKNLEKKLEQDNATEEQNKSLLQSSTKEKLETVRSIIQFMNSYNKNLDNPQKNIVQIINDINNLNNAIQNARRLNIQIVEQNQTPINSVKEIVKKLEGYEILKKAFFRSHTSLRNSEQPESVKRLLDTDYKFYTVFMNKIKEYVSPSRESMNSRLYQLLDAYFQNRNSYLDDYMEELISFPLEMDDIDYDEMDASINRSIKESIDTQKEEKDKKTKNVEKDLVEKTKGLAAGMLTKVGDGNLNGVLERLKDASNLRDIVNDIHSFAESYQVASSDVKKGVREDYESFLRLQTRIEEYLEVSGMTNGEAAPVYVSDIQNVINTSLDLVDDGKGGKIYEIFLNVSFIAGEVNSENKGLIYCDYKGEYMEQEYQLHKNKTTYKDWGVHSDVFYDLNAKLKKMASQKNAVSVKKEDKKGGNGGTYKIRRKKDLNKRNTRRKW
jgi:hypothetical protein